MHAEEDLIFGSLQRRNNLGTNMDLVRISSSQRLHCRMPPYATLLFCRIPRCPSTTPNAFDQWVDSPFPPAVLQCINYQSWNLTQVACITPAVQIPVKNIVETCRKYQVADVWIHSALVTVCWDQGTSIDFCESSDNWMRWIQWFWGQHKSLLRSNYRNIQKLRFSRKA